MIEISEGVLATLLEFVPEGSTVLELGTGEGTIELVKHYRVLSVEHAPEYHVADSVLITVPLVELKLEGAAEVRYNLRFPRHIPWYDADILKENLRGLSYDAILVDGPPRDYSRAGMFVHYSRVFDTGVPVLVDDIHREYSWKIARRIAHIKGQHEIIVRDADQLKKCHAFIR